MDGDNLPADPWWYPGEEAATGDDNSSSFGGHYSTVDLFELVWQVGGGGGATGQPAVSRLRPRSPDIPPPPPPPELLLNTPPTEDVMATWLSPIVRGQDHENDGNTPSMTKGVSEAIGSSGTVMTERKRKLPATADMSDTKDTNTRSDSSEKKTSGGSVSKKGSSQSSRTHSSAEKRRRCKITERLRTLQQLVPGCDKSNTASTLNQTIQYMKLLKTHLQQMSMKTAAPSSAAAAGYPFLHTPTAAAAMPMPMLSAALDPGTTVAAGGHRIPPAGMVPMVQFGAMLPYLSYHAVMMPDITAPVMAAPFYEPGPAVSSDNLAQCSVSMEQQQHKKEKGTKRSGTGSRGSRF